MIDLGPVIAWALLFVSIAALIFLAARAYCRAVMRLSDAFDADLPERILHGDLRTGDLLKPPHSSGDSR